MENEEKLVGLKLAEALQPPITLAEFRHSSLATQWLLARCVGHVSNVSSEVNPIILDMPITSSLVASHALWQLAKETRTD